MKIKVSVLYKIAKAVQVLQKRERRGEIINLDTDLFLAEQGNDIWMSIKYFNIDGKEQLGGILISDKKGR